MCGGGKESSCTGLFIPLLIMVSSCVCVHLCIYPRVLTFMLRFTLTVTNKIIIVKQAIQNAA